MVKTCKKKKTTTENRRPSSSTNKVWWGAVPTTRPTPATTCLFYPYCFVCMPEPCHCVDRILRYITFATAHASSLCLLSHFQKLARWTSAHWQHTFHRYTKASTQQLDQLQLCVRGAPWCACANEHRPGEFSLCIVSFLLHSLLVPFQHQKISISTKLVWAK